MSSFETNQSDEVGRPMGPSAVLELPNADPEVVETINALLGDDPMGFLARREAERLQAIQAEMRLLQEKYYAELRQQTIGHRVISLLRGSVNSRGETPARP